MAKNDTYGQQAQILEDDQRVSVGEATKPETDQNTELVGWVADKLSAWKTHRQSNYDQRWDEYERLWRGIYSDQEKTRKSERSKIIVPALSEAVENSVAEIEEAVFGRGGDFFQIAPEQQDEAQPLVDAVLKNEVALKEDLARSGYVMATSEALLNAAVYGTGIGEIIIKKFVVRDIVAAVQATMAPTALEAAPANQSPLDQALMQLGGQAGVPPAPAAPAAPVDPGLVGAAEPYGEEALAQELPSKSIEKAVMYACLRSVNPRNFLIDPNARSIDDALGCGVEEYVGAHLIREGQDDGTYYKTKLSSGGQSDSQITADPQMITQYEAGNVHVYRYYGLVPTHLLDKSKKGGGESGETEPGATSMTEAIVVIVNQTDLLKAEETPYFMKDRPVVALAWDRVPGRFWGRGVCEKGSAPQKLLDAEFRSRMDALAYASAPMMGMDASRLPRGFKFEVYPGKSILTNGNPGDILKPMQFGQVDQNTYQQAQALDLMVQRATGAVDAVGMAQAGVGGQARSGAVSMSMAGIVKRHRRTLMNFVDTFLSPSLQKILWRQMQFYPERYEPMNFTFNVSSTMGIMQREYESQTLVQMLQALSPESPAHSTIIKAIIENTGLGNRKDILRMLDVPPAPAVDPRMAALQERVQQITLELEIAEKQAKIAKLQAEAAEISSRAHLNQAKTVTEMHEPELRANEIAMKGIYNTPEDQMQAEFDRRLAAADLMLREEDIKSNERLAHAQVQGSIAKEQIKAQGGVAKERAKASQGLMVPVQ